MRQFPRVTFSLSAMRLQLVLLTVTLLFQQSSAYRVAQNDTVSGGNSTIANSATDAKFVVKVPNPIGVRFLPPAFRPQPNYHLNMMQSGMNPVGRHNLKRLPLIPLRGFFDFRNPHAGANQARQNELANVSSVNCSEDSTKCRARYPPSLRQPSKRTAVGSATTRTRRPYDVPQIECPPARDGSERFSCPSPDRTNRYRCIEDRGLCDGFIDCPNAEDEDMRACMFYKTTKAHLDVLADALLRWARGRY